MSQHRKDDLSHFPTREPPILVSGRAFVYILACADGVIYVGSAGDVAQRLGEHGGQKGAKFTRDHPGGRLVYVEGPLSITLALQRERQIKRLEPRQEIGSGWKSDRCFEKAKSIS